MRRNSLRRCLGAFLVVSALGGGCSHTISPTSVSAPVQGSAWPYAAQQGQTAGYSNSMALADYNRVTPPAGAEAVAALGAPVKQPLAPAASRPVPPPISPADAAGKDSGTAALHPAAFAKSSSPPPAPRTTFVDVTPPSGFGHANDYSWLCGQIQYSHLNKTWRLRYAAVDEVDPYGGSVTLADNGRLGDLKDGQYVRVIGRLMNPEGQAIAPPYQVEALQPLAKQD